MDNIKNEDYYISEITKNIDFAMKHVCSITSEEFQNNEVLVNAVLFSFIQISENANRLSEEYKKSHPDVPWNQIRGIRNRIVHEYNIVDSYIIYDTVVNDFPVFRETLTSN